MCLPLRACTSGHDRPRDHVDRPGSHHAIDVPDQVGTASGLGQEDRANSHPLIRDVQQVAASLAVNRIRVMALQAALMAGI